MSPYYSVDVNSEMTSKAPGKGLAALLRGLG